MFYDSDEVEVQFQVTDNKDTKDRNSDDGISGGHADDNDVTDVLCALCDDGGKLLSCLGQCKRSFHPRKKDGRESKCKTLGYTSEELKRIGSYLCRNCEYKKHQCFKCGDLEPSDEPNAKVFKCKDSSCGHFYHPKCVAKLLEPDDTDGNENCELAKRIMEGMSFTCPVHWCCKCGRMEDKTQSALQLAVCRRCPKSYHRQCLPRDISFDTKDKQVEQRAWELSNIIMIYCLDHKICKATGNAKRDHIKFPIMPEISKVSDLCEKKVEIIGKRKRNIGQRSTKSVRDRKRLSSERKEHTKRTAADSSFEHVVQKPENPVTRLKKDLQIEPSVVGAASQSALEASKRKGKKVQSMSSFFMSTRMPSRAVGSKSGKRERSRPQNETSSQTMSNIIKKCILPSKGMFDHSVQDTLLKKPSLDKDAELENEIHQIPEDKDSNKKEKSSEHYLGEGGATNKVTTCENEKRNDVPRKLFKDDHAEENQRKSREERIIVRGETEDGCNSVSLQEGDIYMSDNQFCQRPNEQGSKSEVKTTRNDRTISILGSAGVTPDHVDAPQEKQLIARHMHRTTHKINRQPAYGCNEDGQVLSQGHACLEEPNNSHCNSNSKAADIDVSGNQSSKINEFKRNETDVNNTELKKNQKCKGDGGADHYDDSNHQYPSKLHVALMRVPEKNPSQLKELDHMDHSYKKSGDKNLRCDDENRVAETSECKTVQGTGSSRIEYLTCSTKENSSDSPMGGNVQKKSMNHATEGKRSYCDLYDQNPGNNYQYRYEHPCQVSYSNNNNYESNGSMRSSFTPAGFGAGQWHGPFPYPRGPENGITGWQSPPFHPRSTGFFNMPFYPGRPEHPDYTTYRNNLSNFNHGEYHAMGTDPGSRYFPRVSNYGAYQPHIDLSVQGHGAMYGGSTYDYGVSSNYTFGWGLRTPAGVSVTDRYAPCLEQTNYQPRRCTMF